MTTIAEPTIAADANPTGTRSVYTTIGALVDGGFLPAPTTVAPAGDRVSIGCRYRADVDTWAQHLGMPAARVLVGRYASVDWWDAPGWCGFTTVDISTSEGAT